MVYEYKRVFGKSDPLGAGSRAGLQSYNEQEMYVMHNVTDEVIDGEIDNMSWSELPYNTKLRKIMSYTVQQLENKLISQQQYSMLRSELITLLSKRKLGRDCLVEYDIESKTIISIPCLVFDPVMECYNFVEEKTNSSIKKTILKENVSKI
tara:strand:+ start:2185 stop:2637 length:453 start_codon:yes stop_codon:yes gene_type:complete